MAKRRALRSKFIAFAVAVMLMFCGFGTEGIALRECRGYDSFRVVEGNLVSPGAGEFFTGSLPLQESQSVRELSTDWQSAVILRPSRLSGAGSGCKEMQICTFFPDSLRKVTFYKKYSVTDGEAPAAHDTEVVVCYIHNQDGAKG